jgi:hypothetical protein
VTVPPPSLQQRNVKIVRCQKTEQSSVLIPFAFAGDAITNHRCNSESRVYNTVHSSVQYNMHAPLEELCTHPMTCTDSLLLLKITPTRRHGTEEGGSKVVAFYLFCSSS